MQFLPSIIANAIPQATEVANQIASAAPAEKFGDVFSSYIEEGRYDYTGRPTDFAATEDNAGTVSLETAQQFKNALRKQNAQQASMNAIDHLLSSNTPLTVSKIFNVLSGNARVTPALEEGARDSFKQLAAKLEFTPEETENLLALSDQGQTQQLWKTLSGKLQALGKEPITLTIEEISSVLQSLDVTKNTARQTLNMFSHNKQDSYNPHQMLALLGEANKELHDKALASKAIQTTMRGILDDALQTGKLKKISDPDASMHSNNRSKAEETRMVNAQEKNILPQTKNSEEHASRDMPENDDLPQKEHSDKATLAEILQEKTAKKHNATPSQPSAEPSTTTPSAMANVFSPVYQGKGSMPDITPRQAIFSQVESAILQQMNSGARQLTMQLDTNALGQMTVILSMHEGELRASVQTESKESAAVLQTQLAELRQSLEEQGIKVSELEVRTKTQDNPAGNQWQNAEEHNMLSDAESRARHKRLTTIRRGAVIEHTQNHSVITQTPTYSDGLHVVA